VRINFGLAGLALLISVALWVLVINDQNPERIDTPDISIPVEINKVPPGLVVMNSVEPVRFKIRAPKDRWTGLRASSFRASVDLSHVSPGIQAVPVQAEASDPQIHVLEVVPSTVSIRVEEIQDRSVPVKVDLAGNVPFGYVFGAAKADPEVVVVSGPSSLVQSVETAVVDVRLEGITVDINSAFHPTPVDSAGSTVRGVRLTPQTVNVRVPVDQQVSYKQVGVRPSLTGTVAPGYWVESVTADPATVTVVGDPKVLGGIDFLNTSPLSIDGASTNITQDLRIVTPQGISLVQQQSTRVKVNIAPLQTSQVVRVAPRVVNLDSRLQVVGLPAYVQVTLQGPAPVMQGLRIDSVVVTLDALNLSEGTNAVKPSISTPPGVTVVSVDPESATLVLAAARSPTPTATPAPSGTAVGGTATPVPSPAPAGTPVPAGG